MDETGARLNILLTHTQYVPVAREWTFKIVSSDHHKIPKTETMYDQREVHDLQLHNPLNNATSFN